MFYFCLIYLKSIYVTKIDNNKKLGMFTDKTHLVDIPIIPLLRPNPQRASH